MIDCCSSHRRDDKEFKDSRNELLADLPTSRQQPELKIRLLHPLKIFIKRHLTKDLFHDRGRKGKLPLNRIDPGTVYGNDRRNSVTIFPDVMADTPSGVISFCFHQTQIDRYFVTLPDLFSEYTFFPEKDRTKM